MTKHGQLFSCRNAFLSLTFPYLELLCGVQLLEHGLRVDRLLQRAQELLLERVDLVDVAEQCRDLRVGEEALVLQGLQVRLHQVVCGRDKGIDHEKRRRNNLLEERRKTCPKGQNTSDQPEIIGSLGN